MERSASEPGLRFLEGKTTASCFDMVTGIVTITNYSFLENTVPAIPPETSPSNLNLGTMFA